MSDVLKPLDVVTIDLTAGMDTRVVAALTLRHCDRERITAYTYGMTGDADYETGKVIATICGIPHHLISITAKDTDSIDRDIEILAFYSNGQATASRNFGKNSVPRDALPRVTGHSAAFHKGHYYPNKFITSTVTRLPLPTAQYLTQKILQSSAFLSVPELDVQ